MLQGRDRFRMGLLQNRVAQRQGAFEFDPFIPRLGLEFEIRGLQLLFEIEFVEMQLKSSTINYRIEIH